MTKQMIALAIAALLPVAALANPASKAEKESKKLLSAVERRAESLAKSVHSAGEKAVKSAARGLKEAAHQGHDAAHAALDAVK
jgi:hypothetical protein